MNAAGGENAVGQTDILRRIYLVDATGQNRHRAGSQGGFVSGRIDAAG